MNQVENRFLNDLRQIIESHLSDEHFGVDALVKEYGISRSQLHRRLKNITGYSVGRYILGIRLAKAKELLEKGELTVSQVGYEVGFSSISYFCKSFRKYYGFTPGEIKIYKSSRKILKGKYFLPTFQNENRLFKERIWHNFFWTFHPKSNNKLLISLFSLIIIFILSISIFTIKKHSLPIRQNSEKSQIDKKPNIYSKAHDYFLEGKKWFNTYKSTYNNKHLIIAEELFNTSLSISPNYPNAFFELAKIQQERGNLELMYNYANRSIEIDPQYAEGYELIGEYHYEKKEGNQAKKNLIKSLKIKPTALAYYYLGLTYFNIFNKPIKGISYLDKEEVITLIENHQELLLNVIQIYFTIGDYTTAKQYINKLSQCNSSIMHSFLLIINNNIEELRSINNSLVNADLCEPNLILNNLAISFFDRDYKKCEESYFKWKSLVTNMPGVFNMYLDLSLLYVSSIAGHGFKYQHILDEVKNEAEKLLYEGDGTAYFILARISAFQHESKKAIYYLKEYENYGFRNGHHDLMLNDPIFEELKGFSEFQDLVKRVQKEKSKLRHEIGKV